MAFVSNFSASAVLCRTAPGIVPADSSRTASCMRRTAFTGAVGIGTTAFYDMGLSKSPNSYPHTLAYHRHRRRTSYPHTHHQRRRYRWGMQIPPEKYILPLSDAEKGPPGYIWNDAYPGTLKPGIGEGDNFPLDDVMQSKVYERMVYDEFDMDERVAEIMPPDDDLLEWLDRKGRLIGKDDSGDDFEMDADDESVQSITEDDLDFNDDDSKMIAYYSRQSEGSTTGSSSDFGGFSEPSDYDAGF